MMTQKSILLIVGGGIAAYKIPELVRVLDKKAFGIETILTGAGAQFVTSLTLASLTRRSIHTELFDMTAEAKMGHIELSRSADLVVVAPATADLLGKLANGLANDLASTALMATDKPIMIAPAMNVRMWESKAVQRNVATLRKDGVTFVGPDEGSMACGEFGFGRMSEPAAIGAAIEAFFNSKSQSKPLLGRHAIVTAGPTLEAIDPVRFLSNRSSGKQGYAIARALSEAGARVTLVSGPTALEAPLGVSLCRVESAEQMRASCMAALPADIFVGVAAVADWRPALVSSQKLKLKGTKGPQILELKENPDILASIAQHATQRPQLVIGFAAETDQVKDYGLAKLLKKQCDLIIANDVSGDVMGGSDNAVTLISRSSTETWKRTTKEIVADRLVEKISELMRS
jgi:phosphopantothenoylcysteine decarboxylase / phosphopantothenate---cysteine ligase